MLPGPIAMNFFATPVIRLAGVLLVPLLALQPGDVQAVEAGVLSRLFGRGESMRFEINTPTMAFSLKVHGSLTINATEDDIERLTSWAAIEDRRDGVKRVMTFKLEKDNSIRRTWTVNGKTEAAGEESRRWLASVLPVILRESGLQREDRITRFLAKGGVEAVVAEMQRIETGHARRQYMQSLVERGPLTDKQLGLIWPVIAGIDGDYDKRQALTRLIAKQTLGAAQQATVLGLTSRMDSSHEKRSVLIALAPRLQPEPAVQTAWANVLKAMDSDYERREAVTALIRRDGGSPTVVDLALQSVRFIDQDYERASALVALLRVLTEPTLARVTAYVEAASGIQSDFERRNALESLVKRVTLDKRGFELVLQGARGMKSDHEIRSLLVAVARRMPADAGLIAAYGEVARKLSDHERGQAEKALERVRS